MKLIWHIAKKDLRRLALPVAVWIVLIVAPTVAFVAVSPPVDGHAASMLDEWRTIVASWVQLLSAVHWVIGYVLAGALVLEDPIAGSSAFWKTRPIGNGRLFVAKLLAAALLFVAAPAIALTPLWLGCGFGAGDVASAAGEFALRFGPAAVIALTLGSLVRTLPQFLLCSIVVFAGYMAVRTFPSPGWRMTPVDVLIARQTLISAGMPAVAAALAAHQFLTRHVARSWTLLAVALLATIAVSWSWPWNVPRPAGARPPSARRAADRAVNVIVEPMFSKLSKQPGPTLNLFGTTSWRADRFDAPVFARSPDGAVMMRTSPRWASEAGLRTLGFSDRATPLWWQLMSVGRPRQLSPSEEPHFSGTLEIWSVRPHVLAEVPVRVGAESARGPHRVRILELVFHEDRLDDIFIQEREDHSTARGTWSSHWPLRDANFKRHIDSYFLVNRAARTARSTGLGDVGAVEMNSIAIRFRGLGVRWTEPLEGTVLIKVRFERVDRFEQPLEVRGITSRYPERKP